MSIVLHLIDGEIAKVTQYSIYLRTVVDVAVMNASRGTFLANLSKRRPSKMVKFLCHCGELIPNRL